MKPRVLVVEDDRVSLGYFREVLAGLPVQVHGAADCAEALARAVTQRHALWLLDAHLPDGDAITLLPRLRAHASDAVAIAHTASRDAALHGALRDAGFADVLVKPVAPGVLRQAIARHLRLATDTPAWDDAAAESALGGDPACVRELRALYVAELPQVAAVVAAGVAEGDSDAVRAALHRLAASSALAGAREVADAVQGLHAAPCDPDALARFERAVAAIAPT